jgi:hypothetical protein
MYIHTVVFVYEREASEDVTARGEGSAQSKQGTTTFGPDNKPIVLLLGQHGSLGMSRATMPPPPHLALVCLVRIWTLWIQAGVLSSVLAEARNLETRVSGYLVRIYNRSSTATADSG